MPTITFAPDQDIYDKDGVLIQAKQAYDEWKNNPDFAVKQALKYQYRYERYPMMLYRAAECPFLNNKVVTYLPEPRISSFKEQDAYMQALNQVNEWNREITITVKNEAEEQKALEMGFREKQQDAIAYAESKLDSIAERAANLEWQVSRMSEKAQTEAQSHIKSAEAHVIDIPEAPLVKRRGRPRKEVPAS